MAKNLPHIEKMCLFYSAVDRCEHLKQDLVIAAVDEALFGDAAPGPDESRIVRAQAEFERRCEQVKRQLLSIANLCCETVFNSLQAYHHAAKNLKQHNALNQLHAIRDIKEQLAWLVYPHFVVETPRQWLEHLPRFLKGVDIRLQKLQQSLAADQQRQEQLRPYWEKLRRQMEIDRSALVDNPDWRQYRWMLEEMRISLFAQSLKTSIPVSAKRLDEQLAKLK